ncbi:hypothetical protein [Gloeothece verrucosa]|uniref:Uncharacterized protein n=1 Tax=Gloeothece verrucosa (strain PCC 7822) TaxID=497965 RepID=E0UBU0_GLOV7|nr:hypothetical protein [Gloeothece verrucosa]ADN15155.1 conserved hypothetical protein [Gloeothece verrucosa PCC 7822]
MKSYFQSIRASLNEAVSISNPFTTSDTPTTLLEKLIGVVLVVLGYLLSPLCWWNDLVINLPLAYGFGYVCSWIWSDILLPASIVGYWLTNIAGILLMQRGAMNILQKQSEERSLKKELINGLVSSTAYTLVILLLIQLKILDLPQL